MKKSQQDRGKTIELDKYEKCLIVLARHVERCPYCEYKVEEQILEELGYEKIPTLPKKNNQKKK